MEKHPLHVDDRIDLSPVVAALIATLVEPYKTFVNRLLTEGRITQEEYDQLFDELRRRGDGRLNERVAEALRNPPKGAPLTP